MPLLQMPKVLSAIWRQLSGSSMARWHTVLLFRPVAARQRGAGGTGDVQGRRSASSGPSSWQGSRQTLQHSDSKRPPKKKSSRRKIAAVMTYRDVPQQSDVQIHNDSNRLSMTFYHFSHASCHSDDETGKTIKKCHRNHKIVNVSD